MPRPPRLDAPGTLNHVMGRGIEASKIFRTNPDRLPYFIPLSKGVRRDVGRTN